MFLTVGFSEEPPGSDPPSSDPPGSDPPGSDLLVCLTHLILSAGDRVPAGELDRPEPQRVRRTGPGGFLQGPEGEEGAGLLPV